MNRIRMLVLAGAALALSVVVTFLAYRLLNEKLKPTEETTQIIVVRQRIGLGAKLTQADIRTAPWPKSAAMQGTFHDASDVIGRGVIVAMEGNEPVLESKLAPKNAGAGLMTAIPEGMRAVSVKVNDVIGVAGFVVPGAHVDVILTGNPTPNGDMQASKIFLRNVEVLAAGQNVDRDSEGKPLNVQVITLLVSPEDSEKLALVTTEGRIHLALRNPLDKNDDDTRLIQKAELYGALPTHPFFAAPQPPAAPVKVASTGTGTGKPAAPKQQAVTPAPPAPAVPVTAPKVEAPKPPQVVEIQLIQGNTSQKFKFDVKPQD